MLLNGAALLPTATAAKKRVMRSATGYAQNISHSGGRNGNSQMALR